MASSSHGGRWPPGDANADPNGVACHFPAGSGLVCTVWAVKLGQTRLHIDLRPDDQEAEVERLIGLGASRLDVGQGDVPWVVLADPEGNEFCVLASSTPAEADPRLPKQRFGLVASGRGTAWRTTVAVVYGPPFLEN